MDRGKIAGRAASMMKIIENPRMECALRWLLGGVFIYAGSAKFVSPQSFADSIATFQLLPPQGINLLALWLPVFEIALGISLMVRLAKRFALLGVLLMTTIFAFALASALARGLAVDCGCFGGHKSSILQRWIPLGRDLLLCGVALLLYHRDSNPIKYNSQRECQNSHPLQKFPCSGL